MNGSPAFHFAFLRQSAVSGVPGTKARQDVGGRFGFPVIVASDAFNSAASVNHAGVRLSSLNVGIRSIVGSGLSVAFVSPAFDGIVGLESTGMIVPKTDAEKVSGWNGSCEVS